MKYVVSEREKENEYVFVFVEVVRERKFNFFKIRKWEEKWK